ncbi:MAG: LacI family transcriptional regulator [Clostridiales bacterium]|nr:LacI family transcriptional regulator [Clostridiales bacterium]
MNVYTIKDIARLAGVSVTTVSRVMNHRPDVNRETRQKVEKVIEECHFVGNTKARGLKQGNDVIGIIVRGRSNPFLNALAESILEQARQASESFVTEYIDEMDDEFLTALHLTQQCRVIGLIFVGSKIDGRVQVIQDMDLPIVFTTVNAANAALPSASSVAVDDRAMGHLVAQELLNAGHRKVAVFGANPVAGDSLAMRFQGFCDAFAERGFSFDPEYYRETRFSLQAGYDVAMTFLKQHPETTAIFAMSDTVAVGAIRAIRDLGKSVPEDISVFGFDGIDMGRFTVPRLTTVEQPVDEIARLSVQTLLEMIGAGAAPRHLLVDAVLHRRESVGPPAE